MFSTSADGKARSMAEVMGKQMQAEAATATPAAPPSSKSSGGGMFSADGKATSLAQALGLSESTSVHSIQQTTHLPITNMYRLVAAPHPRRSPLSLPPIVIA